jgi:predicted house-cleaning noncanonical NTP pyrophosphatase (MazG superfamily)
MNTYRFDKLVRDNSPANVTDKGGTSDCVTLDDTGYIRELRAKVLEEGQEVAAASPEELPEELGDLLELIVCLAKTQGLALADIDKLRQAKNARRGGFEGRVYMRTISVPPGSYFDDYCRRDPAKYVPVTT